MVPENEEHEKDIAVLIAGAGVSLASLKAMDETDHSAHTAKCLVDRSISAKSVTELALKMGCPTDENTKAKRLHCAGSSSRTFSTHSLHS